MTHDREGQGWRGYDVGVMAWGIVQVGTAKLVVYLVVEVGTKPCVSCICRDSHLSAGGYSLEKTHHFAFYFLCDHLFALECCQPFPHTIQSIIAYCFTRTFRMLGNLEAKWPVLRS